MAEQRARVVAVRLATFALVIAAGLVLAPLVPWVILAAWFAAMTRPMVARLERRGLGRSGAAAIATLGLFAGVVLPLATVASLLATDGVELARQLTHTHSGREALIAIVSPDAPLPERGLEPSAAFQWVRAQGGAAWGVARAIAGAAADALVGLFVLLVAAFYCLADGDRARAFAYAHSPLAPRHLERFGAAFVETGRGLVIGVALTGLAQAAIATLAYAACGVPRAVALGVLTFVAALVPTIGTALVWLPVSIGLALAGKTTEAIAIALVGACVVSTVDNVLRPYLVRRGRLELHAFLVLASMLGGIALFGGWGLVLGPLLVRLALEGVAIVREEKVR